MALVLVRLFPLGMRRALRLGWQSMSMRLLRWRKHVQFGTPSSFIFHRAKYLMGHVVNMLKRTCPLPRVDSVWKSFRQSRRSRLSGGGALFFVAALCLVRGARV